MTQTEDLLRRLRARASPTCRYSAVELCQEAADALERLSSPVEGELVEEAARAWADAESFGDCFSLDTKMGRVVAAILPLLLARAAKQARELAKNGAIAQQIEDAIRALKTRGGI